MKTINLVILFLIFPALTHAAAREYVRDYTYQTDEFDTKYTSRVRAIDGVKQTLVQELGTYIQSVVNLKKDDKGNKSMSHDVVTLTAGVISTKILKENWNRVVYYVKASMRADKEEVLKAIDALRKDYRLEEALRDSLHELTQSRKTIKELQYKMKQQKDEKVLAKLNKDYVKAARDLEVEHMFQRAMHANINGEFEEGFNLLKQLANKNYVKAQSRLGHMYERGMGLKVDYKKAADWYLKSINNGSSNAYARLGFLYERGLGVRQNFKRAAELYKTSADMGSRHGQSRLGRLYQRGNGVKKDTAKALQLYRKSIEKREHGRGYAFLGYMYEKGIEVNQDYNQAAIFYQKAIERGNAFGMSRMAWLHVKGRGVKRDYEKAWVLVERAAKYNNPFGLAVQGFLYEKGYGAFKDEDKAIEMYMKAADQGSRFAMFRIGNSYHKGKVTDQDKDEAIKWYRRAAELGHEKSRKRLKQIAGKLSD